MGNSEKGCASKDEKKRNRAIVRWNLYLHLSPITLWSDVSSKRKIPLCQKLSWCISSFIYLLLLPRFPPSKLWHSSSINLSRCFLVFSHNHKSTSPVFLCKSVTQLTQSEWMKLLIIPVFADASISLFSSQVPKPKKLELGRLLSVKRKGPCVLFSASCSVSPLKQERMKRKAYLFDGRISLCQMARGLVGS